MVRPQSTYTSTKTRILLMSEPTYVLMALLVKVSSMTFLFAVKKSSFMFAVAAGLTVKEAMS